MFINTRAFSCIILIPIFLISPIYYARMGGFDFNAGTSFSAVDIFLVIAVFAAIWAFATKPHHFFKKIDAPLLGVGILFVALAVMSVVLSNMMSISVVPISWSAAISGTVQYGFIFIGFPLIASALLKKESIGQYMKLIAIGQLVPLLLAIIVAPNESFPELRGYLYWAGRTIGTFGNANSFAAVIVVTIPIYVWLMSERLWQWKILGLFGTACSLISLYLTGSFSGILTLAFVVAINLVILLPLKRHPARQNLVGCIKGAFKILAATLLFLLGVHLYAPTTTCKVDERLLSLVNYNCSQVVEQVSATSESSAQTQVRPAIMLKTASTRMDLSFNALELVAERGAKSLVLGHGIRQTTLDPRFHINGTPLDIHMLYILLWVEGGLVLMLAFVAFVALLLNNCYKMANDHPYEALALASGILALATICAFLPHTYLRYFWVPLLPAFIPIITSRKP
jgi:hypothetical protein